VTRPLSAAVVICTSSHDRRALLLECVDSVLRGTRAPNEIIVVVDQNRELMAELIGSLPPTVKVLASEREGLSEARNIGVHAAKSDVVAFIDDDATAESGWLAALMKEFEASDDVLGVGGAIVPRWGADRRWLPEELLWVVGCTYRGHRPDAGPIRNPIGANMAFRREPLASVGGFATGFGKRGNAYETCDETEVSLRLEQAHGRGRIQYVPTARVRHFVPASRVSWRTLLRRSISEGLSKGRLRRLYGSSALSAEHRYAAGLVVGAVPRLMAVGLARRDGHAVLGSASILVSLVLTAAAFLAGAATRRRSDPPAQPQLMVAPRA
jgi:cellulose synthase/poly-beta-1,6-N-acetylglucosamine synthase-like glycosyltransferase